MKARERFDVVYLVLSGTTTAALSGMLRGLVGLGFATVIASDAECGARVAGSRRCRGRAGRQSYSAWRSSRGAAQRGAFAPCSFNSLNSWRTASPQSGAVGHQRRRARHAGHRRAVAGQACGHPVAQESLRKLPGWGVMIVPPVDQGEGPRLAPSETLLDAVRPHVRRG
jgi:hypothetical protein